MGMTDALILAMLVLGLNNRNSYPYQYWIAIRYNTCVRYNFISVGVHRCWPSSYDFVASNFLRYLLCHTRSLDHPQPALQTLVKWPANRFTQQPYNLSPASVLTIHLQLRSEWCLVILVVSDSAMGYGISWIKLAVQWLMMVDWCSMMVKWW